ncbi:MAG: hypothetical protein E7545_07175 [Ruminococcaceae bacterium]|nr:hypothetical protein [Oscillospiraceae bacterium]
MESEILIARITDTQDISQKTSKPKFFGFLSREEAALAQRLLENRNANFQLFGGYEDAQRVMLGCFPDWCDNANFPITAVTFTYREAVELHHKDFLGALMALGITRESVGDILVEKGRTVAFIKDEVLPFVLSNVTKIGRVGVDILVGFTDPLPLGDSLITASATVSSLRLDCVVSALASVSRGKANELIEAGLVSVNSVVCQKNTKQVAMGDAVTVRGKGKFIIGNTCQKTRKDRTVLEYKKYF